MSTTRDEKRSQPRDETSPDAWAVERRGSRLVYAPIALLLVALAAYGVWTAVRLMRSDTPQQQQQKKNVIELRPGPYALELPETTTIVDAGGKPFDFDRLQGEVWAVNVFFTSCTSACRKMMQQVQKLQDDEELAGVRFVSITSDPENDTPGALTEYATTLYRVDPNRWFYITGSRDDIAALSGELMGIPLNDVPDKHSPRMAVIDRDGNWIGSYNLTEPVDRVRLRQKLQELLAKEEPAAIND